MVAFGSHAAGGGDYYYEARNVTGSWAGLGRSEQLTADWKTTQTLNIS
jgi:hypothetical protein